MAATNRESGMSAKRAGKRDLGHGPLASPLGRGAEEIRAPAIRVQAWPPGGRIVPFTPCSTCGRGAFRIYDDGRCMDCERRRLNEGLPA